MTNGVPFFKEFELTENEWLSGSAKMGSNFLKEGFSGKDVDNAMK